METHTLYICASARRSPAQFVLLWLVAQVFDQRGHSFGLLSLPVGPRVGTQGLVSTQQDAASATPVFHLRFLKH